MRRFSRLAFLRACAPSSGTGAPRVLNSGTPAGKLLTSSPEVKQGASSSWLRQWGLAGATAAGTVLLTTSAATAAPAPPATETIRADGMQIEASGGARVQHKIIFVLGGPGSGKGTQCARLLEDFPDIAHFSAGDLLRAHVQSGSKEGNEVAEMIRNGVIVPAEITVGLLQKAMAESGKSKILIDGFPRNASNRDTFLKMVGYDCEMVLFFDCPEKVLEARILGRNQGRTDDNIETIKKRFRVFVEQSMPVIEDYTRSGKVAHINTDRPIEDIYKEVKRLVAEL